MAPDQVDPVGAAALGYPTLAIDMALNLLIALVVVAAVRAVGTALVVALLTTPAATARIVSSRIATMMVLSCAIAYAMHVFIEKPSLRLREMLAA